MRKEFGLETVQDVARPGFVLKNVLAGGLLFCLTGCGATSYEAQRIPENVAPPSAFISLNQGGDLYGIARRLDQATIERSAVVQQENVARAQLDVRAFDRLPQIRPTGSFNLDDGPQAAVGPYLEHVIFDAGRSRISLGDAELALATATLRAWVARNEGIYEGLRAVVDMSRYQARLQAYGSVERDLRDLRELLELRASGGISDRGELLRMSVALQELQREIVGDTASLRRARSDLVRHLPDLGDVRPSADLVGAASQCSRAWPHFEVPMDALARVEIDRSRNAANYTRAQRLPRFVLGAGATMTNLVGAVTPGLSVNVDAGDMIGLGGRARVEAAELESSATVSAYEAQRLNTAAELARLEANYAEYLDGLRQLQALQRTNRETVALYQDQLAAGSIPLVEGIALYHEVGRTQIDIIDLHADALINCLRSSQVRGVLAPFTAEYAPADE